MFKKLFFFVLATHALVAQDSLSVDLSEIKVTGNINSTSLLKTARNITVIDSKTIEALPVKTIAGVLSQALNVDVRSRSPLGVQSDVSIRGGHFDQTLVMIDGIKINDPQTGHHSMNIPVPIEMIERIEVLQGGASRVYGPAAFSGVINIITKRNQENGVDTEAQVGAFGLQSYGQNIRLGNKNYSGSLGWSKMKSDGYAYNTAFDRRTLYSINRLSDKSGEWTLQGGLTAQEFGASNFYHPAFFDQYEETGATFIALSRIHNFSNKLTATMNLSYRVHDDMYDFNNYRDTLIQRVNFHQSAVADAEVKLRYRSDFGVTSGGLEFRNEAIKSNRLGDDIEPEAVKGFSRVYYSKAFSRDNYSVFIEHQKEWDRFGISAGTLVNLNSQFGTEFYPGVDISFYPATGHTVYGTLNRSLRFPTFTEQYLNTSTVRGNPELLPEKALNSELGYKYAGNGWLANASLFYKKTSDAIDKVKRPEKDVPEMENIDDINMAGLELSAAYTFNEGALKRVRFNYAYLKADRKEDGFQSFYTLNFLRHNLGASFDLQIAKGLNLTASYNYQQREGAYQASKDEEPVSYMPVHLVNTRLAYQVKCVGLFVDAQNLLDYQYFDFGFVEQPGRWLSAGVKLSL
ncbi:TonB-dependent receptor [Jiulongibacter sp. NS-SX5]|uniref:TonB-dependent receptor n=1 Tax=Jiulongibacter sp. NS-SX5 TaxID=3463854 RepID=UPI0040589F6E